MGFTPDGDTVFLSEEKRVDETVMDSKEDIPRTAAYKLNSEGSFMPVEQGGGLHTTQLVDATKKSLTMGAAGRNVRPTSHVPFKRTPQRKNHLGYAMSKKKGTGKSERKITDEEKAARREQAK